MIFWLREILTRTNLKMSPPIVHFSSDHCDARLLEYTNFVDECDTLRQHLLALSIVEDERCTPTDLQTILIGAKLPSDIGPHLFRRPCIFTYGKVCRSQRSVGFFSDVSKGYKYSKQMMPAQSLPSWMRDTMERVNATLGTSFNAITLNFYADGRDEIASHADDEKNLNTDVVAAISIGAERKFVVTEKKKVVASVRTVEGSLLVMSGADFQATYRHHIPKELKIKEPRWSLTFRNHLS
jgi:alkylated DNA repair dioxygenase AlkB